MPILADIMYTLFQRLTVHAQDHKRNDDLILAKERVKLPKEYVASEEVKDLAIKWPSIAPSNMGCCKIIDLQYLVRVQVVFPWYSPDLKVDIPVTIGTTPLEDAYQHFLDTAPKCFIGKPDEKRAAGL